jgi:hypothetical protein
MQTVDVSPTHCSLFFTGKSILQEDAEFPVTQYNSLVILGFLAGLGLLETF